MDKTDITSLLASLLLLALFVKEFKYMRERKIPAIPKAGDLAALIIADTLFVLLGYFKAKTLFHAAVAALAVLFFTLDVLKQGVSERGVIITAKGKQLYLFSELSRAECSRGKKLSVSFYSQSGALLCRQYYRENQLPELTALFERAELPFETAEAQE